MANSVLSVRLDQPRNIRDIADACGALECLVPPSLEQEMIVQAAIDSREAAGNAVFFALKGEKVDAHRFVPDLAGKTAAVVVSSQWAREQAAVCQSLPAKGTAVLIADDPLAALQTWARNTLSAMPGLKRIGVTGSSGKTTVKDMLLSVFSAARRTWGSPGNMNSVIGLPLAILGMGRDHEYAVFEMGMSERGEMASLASIVFPDRAIITSIGTAHIGNIGSEQGIAEEKISIARFMDGSGLLFLPENSPWRELASSLTRTRIREFGQSQLADLQVRPLPDGGQELEFDGRVWPLAATGEHIRNDALGVIALARECGLNDGDIARGLAAWRPGTGRGVLHAGKVAILEDCYNANPDSMAASVQAFVESPAPARRVLVLGDMRELGESSAEAHRRIGELVAALPVDQVIFFGPEMAAAHAACQKANPARPASHCSDFDALVASCPHWVQAGDRILLKASRGMALERIMPHIRQAAGDDSGAKESARA